MQEGSDISVRRVADTIDVTVRGDFDALSANRLIEVLKQNSDGVRFAFIRTEGVQKIEPEGEQTFRQGLNSLNDLQYRLIFADENGSRIHPNIMDIF